MIEKQTIVDLVEISRDGTIGVRLIKAVVEDETILAEQYHRCTLPPGSSLDDLSLAVNNHLESMGHVRPTAAEWDKVREIAQTVHRPEVIEAFKQKQAENMKSLTGSLGAAS